MDGQTAHTVASLCARELGGDVVRTLFAAPRVHGVELGDGRRVVVKLHARPLALVQEVVRVQMHLASRGLYAPTVVGGPLVAGDALATVEALVEGELRDAADPVVQRALAEAHARIVAACRPLAATSSLPRQGSATPARAHGSDDDGSDGSDGEWLIVHGDWRAENVRFRGDAIVAAYGWGNLRRGRRCYGDPPGGAR